MSWKSEEAADLMVNRGWLVTKTSLVLLTNARVIDPALNMDEKTDILVERGVIKQVGKIDKSSLSDYKTLDLKGKIIAPGFFDMHVHLREPGREDKETILTGTTAAAAGGFTGVACMPNTDPPLDNVGVIRWVYDMAVGSLVGVHPVGAVTKGRKGGELSEISDLYHAGVRMISNDGDSVTSSEVMRRALEYSSMHDLVISTHSEDKEISSEGVMREGEISTQLGLAPWPSLAESIIVARDILLAEFTGGRVHVGHISSEESVRHVRYAKAKGVNVTCEATPHHIALNDEACTSYDANFKMNPPLGTEQDRLAVIEGLKDGTIDCIATDHAPHTHEDKLVEFNRAPFGVVGLETAVGVVVRELINTGIMDWPQLVEKMAVNPRNIMRHPPATIQEGSVADLTMIDPVCKWTVEPTNFFSKGKNTSFAGEELTAKPIGILNRGWIIVSPEAKKAWKE